MAKRFLHILLIMVLMVSTAGFTVTKHYCGDELVDFSVTGHVDKCCDSESGCCHDESQSFVLHEDFTSPVVLDYVTCYTYITYEVPEFIFDTFQGEDSFACILNIGESPPTKEVSRFLANIQVYRL